MKLKPLTHSTEALRGAVLLPDRAFVELQDPLFMLHGLGPRYALVQNATVHGRELSYAMLDLPGTSYDLITDHDAPRALGQALRAARRLAGPPSRRGLRRRVDQLASNEHVICGGIPNES